MAFPLVHTYVLIPGFKMAFDSGTGAARSPGTHRIATEASKPKTIIDLIWYPRTSKGNLTIALVLDFTSATAGARIIVPKPVRSVKVQIPAWVVSAGFYLVGQDCETLSGGLPFTGFTLILSKAFTHRETRLLRPETSHSTQDGRSGAYCSFRNS